MAIVEFIKGYDWQVISGCEYCEILCIMMMKLQCCSKMTCVLHALQRQKSAEPKWRYVGYFRLLLLHDALRKNSM